MRQRIDIVVEAVALAGAGPADRARLEAAIAGHLSARLAGRPAPADADATARAIAEGLRSAAGPVLAGKEGP